MPPVPALYSAMWQRYPKSYLSTVRPKTTVLTSALHRCSSPHDAGALPRITQVLFPTLRHCSPIRDHGTLLQLSMAMSFALRLRFLPFAALSFVLPITLGFASLALTSHFPGAHLRTLPTITSALCRDSPMHFVVALFPISSALSFFLRQPPDLPRK